MSVIPGEADIHEEITGKHVRYPLLRETIMTRQRHDSIKISFLSLRFSHGVRPDYVTAQIPNLLPSHCSAPSTDDTI
jgi:hypothetical protein